MKRLFAVRVVLLACFLVFAFGLFGPAYAATVSIDLTNVWDYLQPIILAVVAAVGGWLINLVRVKLNLSIDDSLRNSLQTALTNAAGLAVTKLEGKFSKVDLNVNSPAVGEAIKYVVESAPDAMKRFGLEPADLANKILAKIPQVSAPPAPVNNAAPQV